MDFGSVYFNYGSSDIYHTTIQFTIDVFLFKECCRVRRISYFVYV